jgi:hypothetical protein
MQGEILLNNLAVFPEQLIVDQLVGGFPTTYGTPKFIIVFTTAHIFTLFWARWIHLQPLTLPP